MTSVTNPHQHGVGNQDWLELWRRMYDAERAQGEAFTDPAFPRSNDAWAGRAHRFAAATHRVRQPDPLMQRVLTLVRPTDTVIDIGAGTGRYVPPLARAAARVIALEPSAAMRDKLHERVAAEQLPNVEVSAAAWPAEAPLAGDVVFAAHVIYGVREVAPFLLAMDRAARRTCMLGLGLRHPGAALAPFWERVHGEPRLPLPAALEALCCLHQLGLPASLEVLPNDPSFRFADAEQALEEIRQRLRVVATPERDARIRSAIADFLRPTPSGELAPVDQPQYTAMIAWPAAAARVLSEERL
jgi:SAM-dependent methyltransferase